MQEVSLRAEPGRVTGSRAARRLRHAGKVPAVLYGHGVEAVSLAVDARELRGALTGDAGLNALITLELDGDRHLAMARQLQRHPVKGSVDHVDFVIVRRDEVVSAEVPVHLVGEATEVLNNDGLVDQQLFALTINAKPGDIPAAIEVDISGLVIGEAVRVGDLKLPSGVTTDLDPEETVVVGQAQQQVEEPEVAEGEEAERAAAEAEGLPAETMTGEGPDAAPNVGGGDAGGDSGE